MSEITKYRQVTMVKIIDRHTRVVEVSYIPEEFALVGNVLKIKDLLTGEWDTGWGVTHVGSESVEPPDYRKAIRGHRKNTGDSLPKVI